ncbi:Coenzyme q-binding protein coq10, partial [Globisporangium splendens]
MLRAASSLSSSLSYLCVAAALRSTRTGAALSNGFSNSNSSSRPFFSFASPSQALVKSHKETKVVPFSPEEMYDVVADVNKYHEFLPFCVESRVLRQPNGNVMEAALKIGFKVFTESYTSRVIMKRPEKIVVKAIESPTFKRIESEWVFRPTATPNTCAIDFKVTFEVASFLHANAIQLFFDDVAVAQLNAFIGRAKKVYSTKPRRVLSTPPQQQQPVRPPPISQGDSTFPIPRSMVQPVAGISTETSGHAHHPTGLTSAQRAADLVKMGISMQHFQDLEALFDRHSVDNGKMYFDGFMQASRELGGDYAEFKDIKSNSALAGAIFSSFGTSDPPKDWLNLDEFVVGVYLMTKGTIEEKARNLFHVIDTMCDGKISREELTTAMQHRIRTVKKIFPKLLNDQVQIQMQHENVTTLSAQGHEAMSNALKSIETLMEEIEKEIPLAVNQIFQEADLDQDDFITQDEWLFAWQAHPEFVELMTIDGMKKFAQWASVVHGDDDDDDNNALDTRLTYVD